MMLWVKRLSWACRNTLLASSLVMEWNSFARVAYTSEEPFPKTISLITG
jgi:hypothetical protein